jgi:hypothetical protein
MPAHEYTVVVKDYASNVLLSAIPYQLGLSWFLYTGLEQRCVSFVKPLSTSMRDSKDLGSVMLQPLTLSPRTKASVSLTVKCIREECIDVFGLGDALILELVDLEPYFICTVTHALSVDTDSPQAYVKRQLAWSRPCGVVREVMDR